MGDGLNIPETFTVRITPCVDLIGWSTATCAEIPGSEVEGESIQEVLNDMGEAIEHYLNVMSENPTEFRRVKEAREREHREADIRYCNSLAGRLRENSADEVWSKPEGE
jgi:predicted RNase H-like HicB family nuclease